MSGKPLIFISHKHVDRRIATVIRGFISEKSQGNIDVYQSSDAEAKGPRPGSHLNGELRHALWIARLVILVYTSSDRDWGHCTWECGVATNPDSPDSKIVVFRCGSDPVPDIFSEHVHVNVRQSIDVKRFVTHFMTAPDFLPGSTEAVTGFDPSGPEVARAAQAFSADLLEVIPAGGLERFLHPFLEIQLPRPLDHGAAAPPADATQRLRTALLSEGTIVRSGGGSPQLFGLSEIAADTPMSTLFQEWQSFAAPGDHGEWIDSLSEQILKAVQSQLAPPRWTPMQLPETSILYIPVVVRMRTSATSPQGVQFYIHFLPWREAGRTRASDRDRSEFRKVFGSGVSADGLTAVFPSAKPVGDMAADGTVRNRGLYYPHGPAEARQSEAKDIEYVVPFEDLQASTALAEMCERVEVPFHIELDLQYSNSHTVLPAKSLVSLGLGFNHVTSRLSRLSSLFKIVYADGTDDFVIGPDAHGFPDHNYDCALLARIVAPASNAVPHFVCAGRTAAGTFAAGLFLARRWKLLLKMYENESKDIRTESVALVIAFNTGALDSGEIHGRPLFASLS